MAWCIAVSSTSSSEPEIIRLHFVSLGYRRQSATFLFGVVCMVGPPDDVWEQESLPIVGTTSGGDQGRPIGANVGASTCRAISFSISSGSDVRQAVRFSWPV